MSAFWASWDSFLIGVCMYIDSLAVFVSSKDCAWMMSVDVVFDIHIYISGSVCVFSVIPSNRILKGL